MTLMTVAPQRSGTETPQDPVIVCCHIPGMLHEETHDRVLTSGIDFRFPEIDPVDPYAYARTFRQWWDGQGTLLWVEQDIVPPPGAFQAMLDCAEPWCSYEYHCNTATPAWGLGLCKFVDWMQIDTPTLGEQASRDYRGFQDRMHYAALNERIQQLADHMGYKVHLHEPRAEHLHDYGRADAGHPQP